MQLVKKLLQELILLIILFVLSVVIIKVLIAGYLPGSPEIDINLQGRAYLFNDMTLGMVLFVILTCVLYGIRFLIFRKSRIHVGIILLCYMLLGHGLIWYYGPVYKELRGLFGGYELALPSSPNDPDFFQKVENSLRDRNAAIDQELLYIQLAVGFFTVLFLILFIRALTRKTPPGNDNQSPILDENQG